MQLTVEIVQGAPDSASLRLVDRASLGAGDVYDPLYLSFPRPVSNFAALSLQLLGPQGTLLAEVPAGSFSPVPSHPRLAVSTAALTLATGAMRDWYAARSPSASDSDGGLPVYVERAALVLDGWEQACETSPVPVLLRPLSGRLVETVPVPGPPGEDGADGEPGPQGEPGPRGPRGTKVRTYPVESFRQGSDGEETSDAWVSGVRIETSDSEDGVRSVTLNLPRVSVAPSTVTDRYGNVRRGIRVSVTDPDDPYRVRSTATLYADGAGTVGWDSLEGVPEILSTIVARQVYPHEVGNLVTALAARVSALESDSDRDLSGVVRLVDGKVPAAYLPSYVDDVVVCDSASAFPEVGETGKIYVAADTGDVYRFADNGSADRRYVKVSDLQLGDTAGTAFPGPRGGALEAALAVLSSDTDARLGSLGLRVSALESDSDEALNGRVASLESRVSAIESDTDDATLKARLDSLESVMVSDTDPRLPGLGWEHLRTGMGPWTVSPGEFAGAALSVRYLSNASQTGWYLFAGDQRLSDAGSDMSPYATAVAWTVGGLPYRAMRERLFAGAGYLTDADLGSDGDLFMRSAAAGAPAWDPAQGYEPGDMAVHRGRLYARVSGHGAYYDSEIAPGSDSDGTWAEVPLAASAAYSARRRIAVPETVAITFPSLHYADGGYSDSDIDVTLQLQVGSDGDGYSWVGQYASNEYRNGHRVNSLIHGGDPGSDGDGSASTWNGVGHASAQPQEIAFTLHPVGEGAPTDVEVNNPELLELHVTGRDAVSTYDYVIWLIPAHHANGGWTDGYAAGAFRLPWNDAAPGGAPWTGTVITALADTDADVHGLRPFPVVSDDVNYIATVNFSQERRWIMSPSGYMWSDAPFRDPVAHVSDIPTSTDQLANGAGYLVSGDIAPLEAAVASKCSLEDVMRTVSEVKYVLDASYGGEPIHLEITDFSMAGTSNGDPVSFRVNGAQVTCHVDTVINGSIPLILSGVDGVDGVDGVVLAVHSEGQIVPEGGYPPATTPDLWGDILIDEPGMHETVANLGPFTAVSATANANGLARYVDFDVSDASDSDYVDLTLGPGKVARVLRSADGKYEKPSGGIPKTDLASAVQTSLGKADAALPKYAFDADPTVVAGTTAWVYSSDNLSGGWVPGGDPFYDDYQPLLEGPGWNLPLMNPNDPVDVSSAVASGDGTETTLTLTDPDDGTITATMTVTPATLTVPPCTVTTYAPASGAALEIAVGAGTSGMARDCVLVIDCTELDESDGDVAPSIHWSSHFHPRTDTATDMAIVEAGKRAVFYISEYAAGEFAVGGWVETEGGNA